jgi:cytochrome c oxidase subunit 4
MSDTHASEEINQDTGSHHITHPIVYLRVFALLVLFMLLTIAAAMVQMGPLNNIVAIVIAVTKAVLVILFFMQVKYSSRLTWLWAGAGFVWLILLFITVGDYLTRDIGKAVGW